MLSRIAGLILPCSVCTAAKFGGTGWGRFCGSLFSLSVSKFSLAPSFLHLAHSCDRVLLLWFLLFSPLSQSTAFYIMPVSLNALCFEALPLWSPGSDLFTHYFFFFFGIFWLRVDLIILTIILDHLYLPSVFTVLLIAKKKKSFKVNLRKRGKFHSIQIKDYNPWDSLPESSEKCSEEVKEEANMSVIWQKRIRAIRNTLEQKFAASHRSRHFN